MPARTLHGTTSPQLREGRPPLVCVPPAERSGVRHAQGRGEGQRALRTQARGKDEAACTKAWPHTNKNTKPWYASRSSFARTDCAKGAKPRSIHCSFPRVGVSWGLGCSWLRLGPRSLAGHRGMGRIESKIKGNPAHPPTHSPAIQPPLTLSPYSPIPPPPPSHSQPGRRDEARGRPPAAGGPRGPGLHAPAAHQDGGHGHQTGRGGSRLRGQGGGAPASAGGPWGGEF